MLALYDEINSIYVNIKEKLKENTQCVRTMQLHV